MITVCKKSFAALHFASGITPPFASLTAPSCKRGRPSERLTRMAGEFSKRPKYFVHTVMMLSRFISFSIAALIAVMATSSGLFSQTIEIFVSPTGNDSASGTPDAPLATLQKAAERVKNASQEQPITIWLSEGTYRLSRPLELGMEHGGTENAPVSWKAISGQKPVISGGMKIEGWKKEHDRLWSAPLPAGFNEIPRELFVHNQRATRARHPNTGYMRIDKAGADNRTNFYFNRHDFPKVEEIASLELILLHDWSISRIGVKDIDWESNHLLAVDSIGFRKLPFFNLTNWEKQPRYFLENAFEFLDAAGEWFCHEKEQKIYYIPLPGESMDDLEAIIPVSAKLLTITGDFEKRKQVGYVNFEGIIFEHASWLIPDQGYCAAQACFYDDRITNGDSWAAVPPAIELNLASHCSFVNCVIRHTGGTGIWIHEQCVNCTISNCHVYDISGNGINIGEGRDRKYQGNSWWQHAGEQVSENNKVYRSIIENCGQQFYGAVGIWAGLVAQTTIQHNEVRHLPYTGISVGWMWSPVPTPSRENIIDANHIHHIMHELSDGGGIYNLGLQPGSRMSNNLIHDVKVNVGRAPSNGMFLDEGITDVVVENNIIFNIAKSPLRFHKATTNIVRNNVLVCGEGMEPFRYNNTREKDIKKIDNLILDHSSPSDMEKLQDYVRQWHKLHRPSK
jgi:hypothetical protein